MSGSKSRSASQDRKTHELAVGLRAVRPDDCDILYSWQTEEARRYFNDPRVPELPQHRIWFRERVAAKNPYFWIVECDTVAAGYVRLDKLENGHGLAVSLLVDRPYQGRGIGIMALKLLREMVPDLRLLAEIHPDNAASRRVFEKAGYRAVDNRIMVSEARQ